MTYNNNNILGRENDKYVNEEVIITGFNFIQFNDLKDVEFEEVIKCMLVGDPKIVTETKNILEPKYKGKFYVTISKPIFLEITNKNISKGNAVKKLVEKLGIGLEEVAAIGDSFNDVSMLEVAGFSCAVGNANSEIKKIVDFVSSSNNDSGLANFIKEMKKDI
ncbi:MAG: HAD-IIB family hydrolase [Sebaldella sp.]|nr:HAD-IIB family hydrolase [Sebaldella sp.]